MEIEESIIGSILVDPTLYHDRIVRSLNPDDFTKEPCRETWIRIQRLVSSGQQINVNNILLYAEGLHSDTLNRWATFQVFDIDTLREKIKSLTAARRKVKALATLRNCITEIENNQEGWEYEVQDAVQAIMDNNIGSPSMTALEVRRRIREGVENQKAFSDKIEFGIKSIDQHLEGGLPTPSLATIFAPAKAGKTTLAATVSFHQEAKKIPHLVITIERTEDHIERIKIARENGIDVRELSKILPDTSDDEFSIVNIPTENYCHYKHSPSLTIDELKTEVLYQKRKNNIRLVVIDYLQLIQGRTKFENKNDFIARVVQSIAQIAVDAKLAIILLAQLGEGVQQSELLAAEQSSNLVLIMNRDRGSSDTWFANRASNISPENDIGAVTSPSAILNEKVGPHFTDPDNFDIEVKR